MVEKPLFPSVPIIDPTLTLKGHTNSVDTVCCIPSSRNIVASGSHDHLCKIWDCSSGKHLHDLKGHTAGIWCVDASPNGKQLVTTSPDYTFRIWDVTNWSMTSTVKGHKGKIYWAKHSPSGAMLATAGSDHCVNVWDFKKLTKPVYSFKMEGQFVRSCCFIGNEKLVLASNFDGTLGLFSLKENDLVREQSVVEPEMQSNIPYCVNTYHSAERTYNFLTCHEDCLAKKWEMGDLYVLEPQKTYKGHYASIRYVCASPNDTEICTCCLDHSARIWDENTAQTKAILRGHTDNVVFADYIDEKTVVTASWDQLIKVYKLP